MDYSDEHWMREALLLAQQAAAVGEVPVGAVVVYQNEIVGRGFNQPITTQDATAHAEIVAMREASRTLNNYRLVDATLYVTLEPCSMCSGAMIHARVGRVVYGATEPKAGVAESRDQFFSQPWLNHRAEVTAGVLADESSELLSNFFKMRREQKRQAKVALSESSAAD